MIRDMFPFRFGYLVVIQFLVLQGCSAHIALAPVSPLGTRTWDEQASLDEVDGFHQRRMGELRQRIEKINEQSFAISEIKPTNS